MYTNIFSFGERNLLDFDTRDVGLCNCMAQPRKLRLRVVNKVFLVTGVLFFIVIANG